MTIENKNSLEHSKNVSRIKNSYDSRNSKTGYMEAGNEQKFKRRG